MKQPSDSGLALDMRVGETMYLTVEDAAQPTSTIAITLDTKSGSGKAGQIARLRVSAPKNVRIVRPPKRELARTG